MSTSSSSSDNSDAPIKDANGAKTKAARISRREFGLDAAVAAALSLSVSPSGLLGERRDRDTISPAIAASEQDSLGPKLTAEQSRDVEAKLANIIRKYGERLSEEQRKHLRRILAYNETMLAPIRAFTLQNGDPPVTVLKLSSGKNNE
ncbi:MAG: hypothetical protein ABSC10_11050 [Candidatus Acidiferrales bacterium]